jgi:two-component system, chemotaxis family, CheB/CheR fusion protein
MSFIATATGREVPLILLVDDHRDTCQMYAEFLGIGFQVVTAADGEQALALVQSQIPDLLITDLSLPGIDGFELIAQVRQNPALREVPIICLSGHGGDAYEDRARAAGSDRVLLKPCMPDKLAEVAAEVLQAAAAKRRGDS